MVKPPWRTQAGEQEPASSWRVPPSAGQWWYRSELARASPWVWLCGPQAKEPEVSLRPDSGQVHPSPERPTPAVSEARVWQLAGSWALPSILFSEEL